MLINRRSIEYLRFQSVLTGACIAWSTHGLLNLFAVYEQMSPWVIVFNVVMNTLNLCFGIWCYRKEKKKVNAFEFPEHDVDVELMKYKISVYERMIKKENMNDER